MTESESRAAQSNYATDANLAKRQALQAYARPRPGGASLLDALRVDHGASILDLGCGNGMWLAAVCGAGTASRTVGADLSMGMLESARRRAAPTGWVQLDAARLPFAAGAFDAVLALWMLYHVHDRVGALRDIRRVLRPGGRLVAALNEPSEHGAHDDIIRASLARILGRPVETWIDPHAFHLDNAPTEMAAVFGDVAVAAWEIDYEVPEPGPIVDLVDSVREPIQLRLGDAFSWSELLCEVERVAEAEVGRAGAIRFTRRGGVVTARR